MMRNLEYIGVQNLVRTRDFSEGTASGGHKGATGYRYCSRGGRKIQLLVVTKDLT